MGSLLIGEVSRRSGVSSPAIRYYEDIGLLAPPHRSMSGYRRYPDATVDELRFIRKAQALGFSLDEIRQILTLARAGTAPCDQVLRLAHAHLEAIDRRIRELQDFRRHLAATVSRWDAARERVACDRLCRFITDVVVE